MQTQRLECIDQDSMNKLQSTIADKQQIRMSEHFKRLKTLAEDYYGSQIRVEKAVQIPMYSFLNALNTNLTQFLHSESQSSSFQYDRLHSHATRESYNPFADTKKTEPPSRYSSIKDWSQYLIVSHRLPAFTNIFASWLKYITKSLQAQLLTSLISTPIKAKLSLFLKLKRECLKLSTKNNIDDIVLKHEDIIGIVYAVYQNIDDRKQICQGVKQLFISFKVTQARIYSVVFIEYALSLFDEQYSKYYEQARVVVDSSNNYNSLNNYSSINIRKDNSSVFQSLIHEDNGLYRKNKNTHTLMIGKNLQQFDIIDRKFTSRKNGDYQRVNQAGQQAFKSNENIMTARTPNKQGSGRKQTSGNKQSHGSVKAHRSQKNQLRKEINCNQFACKDLEGDQMKNPPKSSRQILLDKMSEKKVSLSPQSNQFYSYTNRCDGYISEMKPQSKGHTNQYRLNPADEEPANQNRSHRAECSDEHDLDEDRSIEAEDQPNLSFRAIENKIKKANPLFQASDEVRQETRKLVIHQLGSKSRSKQKIKPKNDNNHKQMRSPAMQQYSSINNHDGNSQYHDTLIINRNTSELQNHNTNPQYHQDVNDQNQQEKKTDRKSYLKELQSQIRQKAQNTSINRQQASNRPSHSGRQSHSWSRMLENNQQFKKKMLGSEAREKTFLQTNHNDRQSTIPHAQQAYRLSRSEKQAPSFFRNEKQMYQQKLHPTQKKQVNSYYKDDSVYYIKSGIGPKRGMTEYSAQGSMT